MGNLMIGIYTIVNKVNGKIYVGKSKNIHKRFIHHKAMLRRNKHNNFHLQQAWNMYGEANFEFEVLVECEERFLYSTEHFWTILLDSTNRLRGYNINPTSTDGRNFLSEETKVKISEIRKKQYKDPTKNPFYGRKHTEETRLKMSKSGRGKKKKPWSEETRRKILQSRPKKYKSHE